MRKALHLVGWGLGALVLLAMLLLLAVLIVGNTGIGRRLMQREVSQLTSGQVQLFGLSGTFPSALNVAQLQLSDARGTWMRAEQVSLRWSPLDLIERVLHIDYFGVGQADVLRRPAASPFASRGSGGGRSHLSGIDIERLAIDTLVLEPPVARTRAMLNVRGSMHYRSMQNVRANLVARRTNGNGYYRLALWVAPVQVRADLLLEEPAGGPMEQLANLPGLGALSLAATIEGPRNAERLRIDARAGGLSAEADGTVDLKARAADITYALHSPPMTPRPGLAWKRIALQGRLHGPIETPRASALFDIEGLMLPDGAQLGGLHAHASADGHLLTVGSTATAIMLPASQPQLLRGSPLTLEAVLHLDAPDRPLDLSVSHRLLELKAHALTRGTRSARFELRLTDLASIAALYQQKLRGTLVLSGTLSQSGSATQAAVNAIARLSGSSSAAQLLGADARLGLAARLSGSAVDVQHLEISGRALSVTASGSVERGRSSAPAAMRTLWARWRISLPNLALLSPIMAGSLETSGTAEGSLKSMAASVQARSTLSVHGGPPSRFEATLQAHGLPSSPSGTLHAHGSFQGAPLRLDASVNRVASALYRVVIDQAAWKSLSASGDLTAGPDLGASHGQLQLRIDHLDDLQPLIGGAIQGSLAANVSLKPSARHPYARFDLAARNIIVHGVSGNAQLRAAGPLDALPISLHAASASLSGFPAEITARARLNETARAFEIDRLQIRYHGETVHLLSRPRVLFARGLRVRNLRLGAGKAVIAVDGEFSPALDFRASIDRLDAPLVNAFDPHLLAQGTLRADAQLRGPRSAPVGRVSLRIADLKLASAAAQGLPALNASASARLQGSSAELTAQLSAGAASTLKLSGRVPVNPTGTYAVRVAGQLDLALMNSILEQRGEHAAGTLTIAARVNGQARAPVVAGTIHLAHGDLRDYVEGLHLNDINARLVGGRGALRIASMSARSGPGQLSVTGTIGILEPGMPLDVSVQGQRIQPLTNDILTANLNTSLHVAGTLRQRLDVTGNVRINHAAIKVPNGFPPSVAVLNVIVPGQKARSKPSTGQLVIGLGITLDAPDSIFVQGRGLDAQLGGKLEVTGTSAHPQVGGGFNMIRGTYSLASTNIKFTTGRVSFNGEGLKGKIDPTLDFLAQASVTYNAAPVVVDLSVTGLADSPKVSLSSTPPLPQDDLLALLLFGKPASQLTLLQVGETAAALASLSGIGGAGGGKSLNPLTRLKHVLGLNALSVGGATPAAGTAAADESTISGASVTAGKYISNRVYVAATESTTGASQVQVDVDLSANLKLQARLGNGTATAQGTTPQNDPGSSIGLTWQHRY